MPKNFIYLCFCAINMLRFLLSPLVRLLALINSPLRARVNFELGNKYLVGGRSWGKDGVVARMAFEVASEGELEQARPLMDELISAGQKIEIIYASPSVEKKIQALSRKYPTCVRALRLPLALFSLSGLAHPQVSNWVTAPVLVLCRYDFFPELLLLKFFKGTRLVLISASLKGRQKLLARPGSFLFAYWSLFYEQFAYIVAATNLDKQRLMQLGIAATKIDVYDFRVMQINKRLAAAAHGLAVLGPCKNFFDSYDQRNKILIAQCWPREMALFASEDFKNKIRLGHELVVLAPHLLQREKIDELIFAFHKVWPAGRIYLLSNTMDGAAIEKLLADYKKNPAPILIAKAGILCELYTLFGQAYVGGGFGRSIHSVLEPYLAGTMVYCGPKVYRSTEYDFIQERAPAKIQVVNDLQELAPLFADYAAQGEVAEAESQMLVSHKDYALISQRVQNVK